MKKLLPCLSYVYWAKIEQITNWSKWLWANSHSHIYLKLIFNQSLYTKFGPVKVRALKTPQHVTVHMPPQPRQAQQRNKFNWKWLLQWKGCALPLLNYSLSIPYADNPKQEPPMQANALDHNKNKLETIRIGKEISTIRSRPLKRLSDCNVDVTGPKQELPMQANDLDRH